MPSNLLVFIGLAFIALFVFLLYKRHQLNLGRPGLFEKEGEEQLRDELSRLVADIKELTNEHVARLDGRIRTLQHLLDETDKRIAELRTLLGKPSAPLPVQHPTNPLHESVYRLVDAGKTVDEVSAETSLDRGEVELILGLRHVGAKS